MSRAAHKPSERHALAPGDTVAERYVVQRVLGEGGMGQVLEVEHAALGRAFALKVLRLEKWSDELVRRFNREARALARITTPRVAQVTDFGIDGQVGPFYVMELLDGETLEQRIEREGSVPPREALAICAELCEALAEVHAAGIIHRDLKPSNVGLPQRGPVGVKLLDFGLAASMDDALLSKITQSQQILGSLPYMAPEQFNAAEPTIAIDIYALGVVLHEALTGRLPFNAPSTAALIHQILSAPPPALPPGLLGHRLLETVLERLLAKEPHQRFASAAAAGQALREVLGALGGSAHPRTRASDASVPHTVEASALGFMPTLAMPESGPGESGLGESGLGESAPVESGMRLSAHAQPVTTAPYSPPTSAHAASSGHMGPGQTEPGYTVPVPARSWPLHLVLLGVLGVVLAAMAGVGTIAALSALRAPDDPPPPVTAPRPMPPVEPVPPRAAPAAAPVGARVEPSVDEPRVAEPGVAEPSVAEPSVAEPSVAEPSVAEPSVAEPSVAEPSVAEPSVAEPSVAEPSVAEPSVAEPTERAPRRVERRSAPPRQRVEPPPPPPPFTQPPPPPPPRSSVPFRTPDF